MKSHQGKEGTGLCGFCSRVQVVHSDRGSAFYQCTRATTDPRYPRYPILPVLNCPGYEPSIGEQKQNKQMET